MKEAMHYEKLDDKKVHCHLCPRNCIIAEDQTGFCKVRKNIDGKLFAMTYGRPCAVNVDPIEKKPLFHFMPGTQSLSIGTVGCNLSCKHCQNWEISQAKLGDIPEQELPPKEVVELALKKECPSISFTYTEPTIFYEYCFDIARIAHQYDIKTVMVTNGYINKNPLYELYPFIDAVNVDLKGFSEDFYKEVTMAELRPVLETLKHLKILGKWIEVTNLIIPTHNDKPEMIEEMCKWIKENLGENVPLHFSKFFPYYKMDNLSPTPEEIIYKAREIALRAGLKFVYIGNMLVEKEENTYCPKCQKLMVGRSGFGILSNNIRHDKCPYCKQEIAGIWE